MHKEEIIKRRYPFHHCSKTELFILWSRMYRSEGVFMQLAIFSYITQQGAVAFSINAL